MSKTVLRATLLSASIAALSLIAAPPALASGGGSSISHGWATANAIYVHGNGLHLTGAVGSHDHSVATIGAICNVKVKFYGTLADGYKHSMTTSQSNGCSYLHVEKEIGINSAIKWKNNSNFCARVAAHGAWQPGEPCVNLHL